MSLELETMGHGATYFADLALGKRIMDVLEKCYANHNWLVDVNHEAGHGSVQLMYEGSDRQMRIWKYGFLFHIKNIVNDDLEKRVMRMGGEVLERYNMARRAASENDFADFFSKGVQTENMVME